MSAPWMKFYPSDWRADPALRMCSIAARGLWMEMLCVMHEAEPYGSLKVNGNTVSERQMAALAGISVDEAVELVAELEQAGVLSRDGAGVIVSRRMQRDKAKADADRENGKRGGNPGLREGVNPPVNGSDKGENKAQKPDTRSQSSSLRSDDRAPAEPTPRQHLEAVVDPARAKALVDHRKRIGKSMTPRAAELMAAKLARCPDPNAAADAIVANGWQGFEPEWLTNRTARAGPAPRQMDQLINSLVADMDHADASTAAEIEGYPAAPRRLPSH